MATDATGTATSPDNIPTYNTAVDAPSGKGFNAAMAVVQTALSLRAPIASPTFTGVPISVTPSTGDNSAKIATTAFVKAQGYAGSGTNHALIVGTGTSMASLATGTSGQILRSAGSGADPAWSTATYPATAGTAANVLRSDGTNFLSAALAAADVTNAADKSATSVQSFAGGIASTHVTQGVGYATGVGGTGTEVAGAVTVNKLSGKITMAAHTIANNAMQDITVTNSTVAATDVIIAHWVSAPPGSAPVEVQVGNVGAGSFHLYVMNNSGASATTSSSHTIGFAVIKAVTA